MPARKMPVEIDVIEQLYGDGEISVERVCGLAEDRPSAWHIISSFVTARTAALFVVAKGEMRALRDWETAALVRNRLHGSSEVVPSDDRLLLRAAAGTTEAYQHDFGGWFNRTLVEANGTNGTIVFQSGADGSLGVLPSSGDEKTPKDIPS